MKSNITYLTTLFALVALLLVGSAFATEESAAIAQATQLQLHIDKALIVGADVVTKVAATNQSTDDLQAILDSLTELRNSIDVNSTTIETVQNQRKQAAQLVSQFRDAAKDLLEDSVKSEIKEKAEMKFAEKIKSKLQKLDEMCGKVNMQRFENFAESQQKKALALGDDLNVSITPELAQRLESIRAHIESCNVTKEQISELRTKIKVEAEALKEKRGEVVADIRADVLKNKADMIEHMILVASQHNVSTQDLQVVQDDILALLDKYTNGEISDEEFIAQSKTLHEQMMSAMSTFGSKVSSLKADFKLENKDARIELRSETKDEWKNWTTERKKMMVDIKDDRKEIKTVMKNGTMQYEMRERMKDGVMEQKIKVRSDVNVRSDGQKQKIDDGGMIFDESTSDSEEVNVQ